MGAPNTAITRFDMSMKYSEFSLAANRRGYIGLQVFTPILVSKQSSQFQRVNVESVLSKVEDTRRAPKATYSRADFEWAPDSYATQEHGVEEVLDDRTIAMYGDIFRAEMIHRQRGINRILQRLEYDAAAALFNTSTWTGSALTTAVSVPWSTHASAKPIDDIDAAIEAVKSSSGMRPNALVWSDYAQRQVKRCAQVSDLLKYSGKDDPKNFTSALAELFDIDRIITADGFQNTADGGQEGSFARMWDPTMAMVCHIADSDDLEDPDPTVGRTIFWSEDNSALPGSDTDGEPSLIVEEYREDGRRGGVLRFRNDRQIKVLHPEAGHLLTSVTA